MQRSRRRLTPLLLAACLIACALTRLPAPVTAAAEAETLSDEEIAEEATLAGDDGAIDAAEAGEDQEEEAVDEKDVLVLTDATFDDAIKKHKYILVEFYAPWCGHCQSLKPEYAKAATALKAQGLDVTLAKVDATVEAASGQKYDVAGYPTLKWFVDGEASDYGGGRTETDIVKWIKKKTGPPAQTVANAAELQKAADGKTYALGYFESFEGKDHKAFEDAARASDDVEFFQTTSAAAAKAAGLSEPGIVVAKMFEDSLETMVYSGAMDKDDIRAFVKAEKVPPYVLFNEENQDLIFNSGIKLNIIVVCNSDEVKKGTAVTKAVRAASEQQKGKIIFVLADRKGEAAEPIMEFFGLERDATEPQVVGFDLETSRKFIFAEPFGEAALAKYASGIVDGRIKPHFKSEEPPAEPYEDNVRVVVGRNFDEVVLDPKKDVLLEAYAPWCGHCKQLAPTYKKLGKRFKDVDSVVIAKIEGTANEHEALKVEGFPTILLFPSGEDQTPIPFDGGDRSLKAMTQFLKANAKTPFTLPKKAKEQQEAEDKADEEEQQQQGEPEDIIEDEVPEGLEMDAGDLSEGEDPELAAAEDEALAADDADGEDTEAAADAATDEL